MKPDSQKTSIQSGASIALSRPRWKDYIMLMKLRLSVSVVISSLAGYLLGVEVVSFGEIALLLFGGITVTGAANGFNQIIEKERDARMLRTQNRPVASGRMRPMEAMIVSGVLGVLGILALTALNPLSATFGAIAIISYALLYTPMKAKTPFAVFVGAFPGAIPIMLGWVAATGSFGIEAGTLFAWQFLWQFPHFWAIGWLLHEDYARAGYVLLPSGKPDRASAFQALLYTFGLQILVILPYLGFAGSFKVSLLATITVVLLGFLLIAKAWKLFVHTDKASARSLMIHSIIYLTLVQIVWVLDKFLA